MNLAGSILGKTLLWRDTTGAGGAGRDIAIGGNGLGTLDGGTDDDILIGGRTTSDAIFASLNAFRTEWISSRSYSTRITRLRAGVRSLSPRPSLKAKTNVLNDSGENDSLIGGIGADWYFRAIDDVISGLASGEITDII